jgi:2,4-dienoyl-CoA reductase-like NADH-dependent reductase (Old Yellow Enzyme family)
VKDVGLVITGCTHVQPNGVGFTGEFASYDDSFLPSLTKLAVAAQSGGAPAILQIVHAGVKTTPDLSNDIVAASAVTGEAGPFSAAVTPRALSDAEVVDMIAAFGAATRRAIEAGFDGVEIHGAHGFIPQNFYSPHSNTRDDRWGGTLEKRPRFPLALVEDVRSVVAEHATQPFVIGYRISPDEPNDDGLRIKDTLVMVDRLIAAGIDYLHVSLPDALHATPVDDPDGTPIVPVMTRHVAGRVLVIAGGQVRTTARAREAIAAGYRSSRWVRRWSSTPTGWRRRATAATTRSGPTSPRAKPARCTFPTNYGRSPRWRRAGSKSAPSNRAGPDHTPFPYSPTPRHRRTGDHS